MTFLKLFDAANHADCYERNESVAPQQALALSNSPLSYSQARLLTSKISPKPASGSAESDFIVAAFQRILGRPPSAQELSESMSFVHEQVELFRSPEKLTAFRAGPVGEVPPATDPLLRAREDFIHALFNHNDFVTIR
jgi:hypothetical protein